VKIKLITDESLDRFSRILKPLGLSEYEIRVFLTLVTNGPSNYRVLGRESNVPIGKIYQVLSTLEAKGFVEVVQEKPKIYKAVEPKKALRRRLKQLEDDFLELEHKIKEELPTLQLQYSLKHDAIQGVVSEIFVGNNSSTEGVQGLLLRASDEVLISAAKFDIKSYEEDSIKRLLERGVSVRVVCSDFNENGKDFLDRLSDMGVNIRVLDGLTDRYCVVDNKCASAFISTFGQDICLQVYGSALCRVLREKFEETWKKARAVSLKTNYKKDFSRLNSDKI